MQDVMVCLSNDYGNVEKSPADLTSASKPINIASVRATSLRTCGLRAAARAASGIGMNSSLQMDLSSSLPKASSSNLSYTNSQEPGEDSQLNAFAMVDKLVDLNAGLIWQTPESNKVTDQASVKGSQSIKGIQSLARTVETKSRHDRLGIYDWIDTQSDETSKLLSTISIQPKAHVCTNEQRKDVQAAVSEMTLVKDLSCKLFTTGEPQPKQQSSLECQLIEKGSGNVSSPTEGSTVDEDAELLDIGANTQIALEAIDIMRHGALRGSPCDTTEIFSAFDVGNDTQIALDAMDILRCGIDPNPAPFYAKGREENEGLRHQTPGEVSKIHQNEEANAFLLPITPGKKGGLLSRSAIGSKPIGKGFSRRASKNSKKVVKAASLKRAGTRFNDNKRCLLDFPIQMVPRRKRSRLHSPRVSINENIKAFGWQKSGPLLHVVHKEADKPNKSQGRMSEVWPGNSTELAVLTETTNGGLCRQTKREVPGKSNCHTLLEQSRKRRKCESKTIFVLFSHSLSEATIKQQKKMLKKLGGHVATSAGKATHFIADSFVRSKNMLEIMAAGKMVVTTNWLEGCSQAEYFVDEESYILTDVQKEKEWGFCMHSSLAASRRKPLLKGMKVVVSPNTVPDFIAMQEIIESAGGQVLPNLSIASQLKSVEIALISFILATDEDYDFCVEYIRKGCKVYSTELILHGVVVQNLDFSRNRLFLDKAK